MNNKIEFNGTNIFECLSFINCKEIYDPSCFLTIFEQDDKGYYINILGDKCYTGDVIEKVGENNFVIRRGKYINLAAYSERQIKMIKEGYDLGVDISKYENPNFNWQQMRYIMSGLYEGLNVDLYADEKYDYNQMNEIFLGLLNNLDVSCYLNPEYDYKQMEQIRLGLQENIDVSCYLNPKFDYNRMFIIRVALNKNLYSEELLDDTFNIKDLFKKIKK